MAKVSIKTADLVGAAIIQLLKPFKAMVKTLTYDNGKEFSEHARLDKALSSRATLPGPLPVVSEAPTRTSVAYCGNKRHMANITDEEIKMIEHRLNTPPQKIGIQNAWRDFHQSLSRIALRA